MHIYFSGIGGVGIGPLAEIALDAGYMVSGSDAQESTMTEQLASRGVEVSFDQSGAHLARTSDASPVDWFVHTAALPSDHPELVAAKERGLKVSKRDELLREIISDKNLKLIAVSGTHGKTTTTGMIVWLAKYFSIPISYCVGTSLSWGSSGCYMPGSEYFVYECDEFDRNFLQFSPFLSLITTIEHDHIDTYPTESEYFDAFRQFSEQSTSVVTWREFEPRLGTYANTTYVDDVWDGLKLFGDHNRRNASLILAALEQFGLAAKYAAHGLNKFPGTSRRFERLMPGLYSDYGHTPSEIKATLQMAHERAKHNVILIYQPHQNTRQHQIKDDYTPGVFEHASQIYWLPTYLSREDTSLEVLSPEQLTQSLSAEKVQIADLDENLKTAIDKHLENADLVLVMGAGSVDAWLRQQFVG